MRTLPSGVTVLYPCLHPLTFWAKGWPSSIDVSTDFVVDTVSDDMQVERRGKLDVATTNSGRSLLTWRCTGMPWPAGLTWRSGRRWRPGLPAWCVHLPASRTSSGGKRGGTSGATASWSTPRAMTWLRPQAT